MSSPPTHYLAAVDELAADPVLRGVAALLARTPTAELVTGDGEPTFAFLRNAEQEYADRGGKLRERPVGAISHAILRLRSQGIAATLSGADVPEEVSDVPQELGEMPHEPVTLVEEFVEPPATGGIAAPADGDPPSCAEFHGTSCPHKRCSRVECLLEGDCCR